MGHQIGIRQLRAFQAVMIEGSVSAAATKLNLTQPAVSKQLSALEYALGIPLFHRKSGTATSATKEGIAFYKASEAIISGLNEMPQVAHDIATNRQRRLRIAATPPVANSAPMMRAINTFRRDHRHVQIAIETRARIDIEDWVLRGQVDFAVALLPAGSAGLTSRTLAETTAVVVLPKDHPLAKHDTITPDLICDHPIILPTRQLLRSRIDDALKNSGKTIQAVLESSSAITCCRMASVGLGVAICDPFSPSTFPDPHLIVKPWHPKVPLNYGVLTSANTELEPPAMSLLDHLEQCFSDVPQSENVLS